jgi:hypothetical protein
MLQDARDARDTRVTRVTLITHSIVAHSSLPLSLPLAACNTLTRTRRPDQQVGAGGGRARRGPLQRASEHVLRLHIPVAAQGLREGSLGGRGCSGGDGRGCWGVGGGGGRGGALGGEARGVVGAASCLPSGRCLPPSLPLPLPLLLLFHGLRCAACGLPSAVCRLPSARARARSVIVICGRLLRSSAAVACGVPAPARSRSRSNGQPEEQATDAHLRSL